MDQAEQLVRYTPGAPRFFNWGDSGSIHGAFGEEALAVGGGALVSPGAVFLVAAVSKAAGSQLCFSPPRIPLSMGPWRATSERSLHLREERLDSYFMGCKERKNFS